MVPPIVWIAAGAGAFLALLVYVIAKPSVLRDPGGKLLAFLVLFMAPGAALMLGAGKHLEHPRGRISASPAT